MKKKSVSSPTAYDVNVFEHETKILPAAGEIEGNNPLTLQYLRAHYLKGSAAMIGAEHITHDAAHLEMLSQEDKDMETAGHLLARVETGLAQLEMALTEPGVQNGT